MDSRAAFKRIADYIGYVWQTLVAPVDEAAPISLASTIRQLTGIDSFAFVRGLASV